MRHRVAGRKLNRNTAHRKAMFRNMAIALFTHGQITTTIPKAKSLKPFVERLITAAKAANQGDLAARRRIYSKIGNPIMVRDEDDESLKRHPRKPNRPDGYQGKLLDGPKVVETLVSDIAPKFEDRNGGYTRIVRLSKHRLGDGTQLCVLMLLGDEEEGPQLSGQFSRRREKANRRAEKAAELRRSARATGGAEAEAATAVAEEEAPAEEAASEEALEDQPEVEAEADDAEEEKKD